MCRGIEIKTKKKLNNFFLCQMYSYCWKLLLFNSSFLFFALILFFSLSIPNSIVNTVVAFVVVELFTYILSPYSDANRNAVLFIWFGFIHLFAYKPYTQRRNTQLMLDISTENAKKNTNEREMKLLF